jgi:hypothetical protein
MPRYDRINSPEEYMNITWDGLYQRGRQLIASGDVSTDEYANATIYANERIFGAAGIDPMYNMWSKAQQELLRVLIGLIIQDVHSRRLE